MSTSSTTAISVVAELDDGRMIEVATVGAEGMIGVPLFLSATTTTTRGFVQVVGHGRRMTAAMFAAEIAKHGELRNSCERYTQLLFEQISRPWRATAPTTCSNAVHEDADGP